MRSRLIETGAYHDSTDQRAGFFGATVLDEER